MHYSQLPCRKRLCKNCNTLLTFSMVQYGLHMSDFFHFHATLHHLTLLYVTLHCSTLLRASSSTKNLSVWLDMPSNSYSPCSFIAANLPRPTGSGSRSKPSMWLEAWPDAVWWECSSEVPAGNARANGCRSKAFRDNCTSAQEESDSRSQKSQDAKGASGEIARTK